MLGPQVTGASTPVLHESHQFAWLNLTSIEA
jgi:hypothetical protein